MSNEELIEKLTKLAFDSEDRLSRANEIVTTLSKSIAELSINSAEEHKRTDNLVAIFDKHLTEIEANRDLVIKECISLRAHCDKLTEMMERCQKMQANLVATISSIATAQASATTARQPANQVNINTDSPT